MTKKDEGTNIFDLAGSQKRKMHPKKTTSQHAEAPPTSTPQTLKQPTERLNPEEAAKMIEKMNRLNEELQGKLESTYEKTGLSKSEIRKVIRTLNEEDKIRLQKDKQELEEKVWGALGEQAREKKLRKDEQRLERSRKAKGVGGRQKWIRTK